MTTELSTANEVPCPAAQPRHPHEVYFLRRLLVIYLPAIVIGMTAYLVSFSLTLTANGLSLFAALWVGLLVLAAALDSREG